MHKTRFSLYYLVTYLMLGGIALIFAPRQSAQLFLSNTEYAPIMLQS